ncbi:dihydrolipoyl dehydrogenase [Paenibacillus sp. KN14-4R]|uniref:dihydrolipoyl dehydrogenase n=1 Tax=Paenibacillus sp. KN14-4R TaxID=3445773 RepID=UPI003F9EC44F
MSSNKPYDVVVLGGGIGGYTAAIRAAQQGKKVAIVEKDKLGGTCLHAGCIPSKAFLRSAEVFATIKDSERYGIMTEGVKLHFDKVQARKTSIVNQLHQGVQLLMRKNKIDVYSGNGRIMGASIFSPRTGDVSVELPDGEIEILAPQQLIIATGSSPRTLPGLEPDGEYVLTSDEAMTLHELPASMLIVGGGVIGVEWASLLNDFGVEVTIVEYENRLVAAEDEDISRELQRLLVKRGVKVVTSAKVLPESLQKGDKTVTLQAEQGAEKVTLQAEKVLVSVGRKPNIEGFGLENTAVKVDRGAIVVNEFLQTAEPHIYAVGDVIGGLQLAHVAGHEGIAAVDHICGKEAHLVEPHRVAKCTYTRPEIASIGWTEKQAREQSRNIKVGKFPFVGAGKAYVYGETDGFVKVIADKDSNDILGVHMIGPHATELIGEAALAEWLNATPWEVGAMIHPHPTLSEALGEAMMAVDGQAIGI